MLIEIKDLKKNYLLGDAEIPVIHGINLNIEKNEYVAIMGPSGSGKSTLMNILGCLDTASSGHYYFNDVDVSTLDDDALSIMRNKEIGFIFQGFNLIPALTAFENVELPLIYRGSKTEERHTLTLNALDQVGLSERIDHKPAEMSGGQQQRVAIARAIAAKPPIIMADEPTGNLDSASGLEIMKKLIELNENGTTIILITHDNNLASFAKRIVTIHDGKIVSDVINKVGVEQ